MIRLFSVILLVSILPIALLSGCSTLNGMLENRLTCTVAGDKAYFISLYGPIGVSALISDQDSAAVCKSPVVSSK